MAADANNSLQQPVLYIGHLESPFFKKCPAEVRVKIYDEALSGSQLTLVRTSSFDSRGEYRQGGQRTIFRSTGHHNLLLTCRAIHEEALPQYWSKTIVFCGFGKSVLQDGDIYWSEDKGSFHLTYLSGRISDFAKRQIKHLRRVDMLKDVSYNDTPQMRLGDFLDLFPRLETCVLDSRSMFSPIATMQESFHEAFRRHMYGAAHGLEIYLYDDESYTYKARKPINDIPSSSAKLIQKFITREYRNRVS